MATNTSQPADAPLVVSDANAGLNRMSEFDILADLNPLPILIVGGTILVAIAGILIAFAVAMFGFIKRRKNRRQTHEETNTSEDDNDSLTQQTNWP